MYFAEHVDNGVLRDGESLCSQGLPEVVVEALTDALLVYLVRRHNVLCGGLKGAVDLRPLSVATCVY